MRLAVPDLISNSYFPAVAAVELGMFAKQGLDVSLELIYPVNKTYEVLRDGGIDFVAGSAHSALAAFPEWRGVKLLCAQAQGMYWFLVMRADLPVTRGDLNIVRGRKIGAAPWVELGLRQLLITAGFDLEKDDIRIGPVPGAVGTSVNFGLTAAKALERGELDGFWANGMGTQVALDRGVGKIVLDIRRGDGPAECFNYTFASLAARDDLVRDTPDVARRAIAAINATHRALTEDVTLAEQVGRRRFPEQEAKLITELIRRDLPLYTSGISAETVRVMNAFCRARGLLKGDPAVAEIATAEFRDLWT
jgi:ABC-type nitrate/sulfonate/bicarbonate transport system substrate-binding protein